jgi:hypothetical protein
MLAGIILPGGHPWRAEIAGLATVAWDGEASGLDEAGLAPLDLLVVDRNALSPEDVEILRRFRVRRPCTRIVVSLPGDAAPGDPVAAALVALGVYDLHQDVSLTDALLRHPTYADAARWHVAAVTGALAPPHRERIVERRVAVSQRPVLILVAGVAPGVGTTRMAVATAWFLARQGHRTALAEYGEPSLAALAGVSDGVAWRPHLHVFAARLGDDGLPVEAPPPPLEVLRLRQHAYVVADIGVADLADLRAHDPDMTVVVCPGDLHRHPRLAAWLARNPEPKASFVVVGGPDGEAADVVQAVGALRVRFPRGGWPPADPDTDRVLARLLEPVLPDAPRRPSLPILGSLTRR